MEEWLFKKLYYLGKENESQRHPAALQLSMMEARLQLGVDKSIGQSSHLSVQGLLSSQE